MRNINAKPKPQWRRNEKQRHMAALWRNIMRRINGGHQWRGGESVASGVWQRLAASMA